MGLIHSDISLGGTSQKVITDKFDFFIQEIEVLFDTVCGEVLGDEHFGADFDHFTWDLSISNGEITEYVRTILMQNTLSYVDFDVNIDTNILYGTKNDIILVKINISDPKTNMSKELTYKI